MPPTPPKDQPGGSVAQSTWTQASTAQSALAFVEQLDDYVAGLKRELRGYGDAKTVGRDTQQLRTYFQNIFQCELQIAQSMGIDWSPDST